MPFYPPIISEQLPKSIIRKFKGEKGAITGQGALKKVKRDPLFSINHTLAMLRANVNRLIRKTWCTTKKPDRRKDHLDIYLWMHNRKLLSL